MELQIKTAMQMRDQGHALKQKALELVAEAELKVGMTALTRWNEQRWMANNLLDGCHGVGLHFIFMVNA